jgi:hypothetical protein
MIRDSSIKTRILLLDQLWKSQDYVAAHRYIAERIGNIATETTFVDVDEDSLNNASIKSVLEQSVDIDAIQTESINENYNNDAENLNERAEPLETGEENGSIGEDIDAAVFNYGKVLRRKTEKKGIQEQKRKQRRKEEKTEKKGCLKKTGLI